MATVSRCNDADLKWAAYGHNLIRPTNGRILSREDTDNFRYLEDREDSLKKLYIELCLLMALIPSQRQQEERQIVQ